MPVEEADRAVGPARELLVVGHDDDREPVLVIQAATHGASFLLAAAFAPRVLLLESQSATALFAVIAGMGLLSAVLSAGFTTLVLRRVRPLLTALAHGTSNGEAARGGLSEV